MTLWKLYFNHLKKLLLIYLLGIFIFTLLRSLLVAVNFQEFLKVGGNRWSLLWQAYIMGWRFDTVISCYLMSLPAVLISLFHVFYKVTKALLNIVYGYLLLLYTLAFLICCIDIPFFTHFFKRLNDTLFNWSNHNSFGFKMVLEDKSFYSYLIVFFLLLFGYSFVMLRLLKLHKKLLVNYAVITKRQSALTLFSALVFWGLIFIGIRGRTSPKTPIIPGTAFFTNKPFINQVGLNPVFTLMRSLLDNMQPGNQRFQYISDKMALRVMHSLLKGDDTLNNISPIARIEKSDASLKGRNVIVVIMESMSAHKMQRFGNTDQLSPFLDSLASAAWSFDNIFSAGIHTYNGIYTTLFAHPAIMKRHTMDLVSVPRMDGFSNVLHKNGYNTIFFTTHDDMFDNMSGFLSANDFDKIVGQKDYPLKEVKSTMGVPDEFMFRYSIKELNELSNKRKPFFAAFMTGSDHNPFIIPTETGFKRRNQEDVKAIVEYADWSLRRFLNYASKQDWYKNSVFVFVADHGCYIGSNVYDVAFSYHHIPFLVFAPGFTSPKAITTLGTQSDVFPTVTSLVLPSYINNTFGINLLKDRRPYIVFSADDKLACMNDSLLYVFRTNAWHSIYKYKNGDPTDYVNFFPKQIDTMRAIGISWVQTSQWMIEQDKCRVLR